MRSSRRLLNAQRELRVSSASHIPTHRSDRSLLNTPIPRVSDRVTEGGEVSIDRPVIHDMRQVSSVLLRLSFGWDPEADWRRIQGLMRT